ncbi:FMN-dependent NADH-azoreductase [Nocardia sp. NPDC056000]|uniref:FMN-dependent NADH-azoreductase n=1 Tax=Nocardia sp. NPDC056000 TaxID=3345674 RepID=UPI0035D62611
MTHLLHIDSSSLGAGSVSREVAQSFLDRWQGTVVHRDLATTPVPHLSAAGITARLTDPAQYTPEQATAAAIQDQLIEEFLDASAYLFTVPMYNLTMPSAFKAWLDQIIVVDRTLNITGDSPVAGRPAVLISARGGGYGPGTPNEGLDFVVPTLEAVLGRLLGLEVITVLPELTMAPHTPALTPLLALHEASMADAHERARGLATTVTPSRAA